MEIIFSPQSLEDLQFWKQSGNIKIQNKIQKLLESIKETSYQGPGKPEALKHNWFGYGQDASIRNTGLFINGKMKK